MNLIIESNNKSDVFSSVEVWLHNKGFKIISRDDTRPWGGFFVLDEDQADQFISDFFPGYKKDELMLGNKLSPKFLIVAPGKRLSWQYHFRRAEIWRVAKGKVKVATSYTDAESETKEYGDGEIITLKQGQRHRLIGADSWGVVAEIWQHTDPAYPSDEEDIVRLQDDFGRG